eukprot:11203904-Lingulodinium_polyedra.AAC.1
MATRWRRARPLLGSTCPPDGSAARRRRGLCRRGPHPLWQRVGQPGWRWIWPTTPRIPRGRPPSSVTTWGPS